jgi:GNAT superfamily N-acetyltransferase
VSTSDPGGVGAPSFAVRLRTLSPAESDDLIAGSGRPSDGLTWHPDYPNQDTFIALGLLRLAHDAAGGAAGRAAGATRTWCLSQIVVSAAGDDVVVGDIGFHGPPEAGPRVVVEIGYAVVPEWRGRGVATRACALILEEAWRNGADLVQAEAVNPASQAVLRKCGFRRRAGDWFEASRP